MTGLEKKENYSKDAEREVEKNRGCASEFEMGHPLARERSQRTRPRNDKE